MKDKETKEDKLQKILINLTELSFSELMVVSDFLSKSLYKKGVESILEAQNCKYNDLN